MDDKFRKKVYINGLGFDSYVDLGSQCTLIKESIARNILDCQTWRLENLPYLRGFGNSLIQPVGACVVNLVIDEVKLNVDLIVVPDRFLNYDVLIGQTITEQPHIEVHKDNRNLVIKSNHIERRFTLRVHKTVNIYGDAMVRINTDGDFSGKIYIEDSQRPKFKIMGGKIDITRGMGYVLVGNSKHLSLEFQKDEIIARGKYYVENVNSATCLIINKICCERSNLTLDDLNIGDQINEIQKRQLLGLINEYRDCFAKSLPELGCTNITRMEVELKDANPVVYRPYRLSHTERAEVRSMVDELLQNNIIRESSSPYASPIIIVKKKTGDKRLCIDYRALNNKTVKQHYPIPRIEDQIDRLAGNIFFSTLDLASGYYQIPLSEESKPKTAFVTPDGQFEFNRMPFGLANAPAVFQRTINMALGNTRFESALAYMDDILVPSKSFEQGLERLRTIFERLRQSGLTLKPQKCYFFKVEVDYLGFEVSGAGIKPGMRKTEAVSNFPTPKDVHNVRQIIGLASFFRRFIKGFAQITKPLTKLLKKNAVWEWGTEQERAFVELKNILTSRPVLALYNPSAETQIHTDASKHGVGGVLLQKQTDGIFKPIAYYSRQTSPEESHFSSYELETLAVISSLIKFRPYVLGMSFTIVTDCNSLRATFQKKDMIPRVARWWSLIQEYNCDIIYRSGQNMTHADALSRNPITDEVGVIDNIEAFDIMCIDNDWLETVQSNDSELKRIKDILSNPEYDELVDIKKNFVLKRQRVYRNTNEGLRWVVPKGCRWQILQKNHDQIGHFGFEKTFNRIKEHYWFSKMRKFIKKYVNSCLECAHNKIPAGKKEGFLHPIPKISTPFHTIHIDHLGPFVTSKRKNVYILVIIDAYSKFIVIKAVKNTRSNTSIAVLRDYFGTFGLPTRLISDRGTSFTSDKFKKFMTELGIRHIQNAVASPRANGQVERYNRTILDSLAAQNHGHDEKLWDDRLLQVQWGLNNTINKGTGKSPSEILFGLKLINTSEGHIMSEINSDLTNQIVEDVLDKEIDNENVRGDIGVSIGNQSSQVSPSLDIGSGEVLKENEVTSQSMVQMDQETSSPRPNVEKLRSEVDKFILEAQEKQKHNFDKKRKPARNYNVGDLVRIEKNVHSVGKSKKLLPKLSGPYKITKVLNNDRYEVCDTPITKKGNKTYTGVFAVDKIFPWLCFNDKENDSQSDSTNNDESENDSTED